MVQVRVRVRINDSVYHWNNCRRSKCQTFIIWPVWSPPAWHHPPGRRSGTGRRCPHHSCLPSPCAPPLMFRLPRRRTCWSGQRETQNIRSVLSRMRFSEWNHLFKGWLKWNNDYLLGKLHTHIQLCTVTYKIYIHCLVYSISTWVNACETRNFIIALFFSCHGMIYFYLKSSGNFSEI